MDMMRVTVEPAGSQTFPAGGVVVTIAGEIGISALVGAEGKHTGVGEDNAMSAALEGVLAGKPTLVVADMSGATYLSSIGMGALLRFGKRLEAAGGRLRLAAVP